MTDKRAVGISMLNRRMVIIIALVVIVTILATIGISSYFSEDARFGRLNIISVDDLSIKMDYFLKRTVLAGADPMNMLTVLSGELVIKLGAPKYVGQVTPEEIEQELRRVAQGDSETISDAEFEEWYRQQLNESGLSDAEYRDYATISLLASRLYEYLADRMPTVVEQVYLYYAQISEDEVAEVYPEGVEVDVDVILNEIWHDKQSQGAIEDIGWTPRGVLPEGFDDIVFSLSVGELSPPLPYVDYASDYEIYYYIFMLTDGPNTRELDEEALQALENQLLDNWVVEETKFHEVEYNFDSEIYTWINQQL